MVIKPLDYFDGLVHNTDIRELKPQVVANYKIKLAMHPTVRILRPDAHNLRIPGVPNRQLSQSMGSDPGEDVSS